MLYHHKNIDIVVNLKGGLGNRLTSLYSSYYLSNTYNLPIKYFWQKDIECEFNDIFESNEIKLVENFELIDRLVIKDSIIHKNQLKNKIFWTTFECIFFKLAPGFLPLPIKKNIKNIINQISIDKKTLGVHVRGGDIKKREIKDSRDKRKYVPPENFLPIIDKLLNNHNKIFLSCENKEDEIIFFDKYKNKINKLENAVYSRSNLEGISYGLANMMILSKCSTIVGMNSSFSYLASKLGNAKKITI